MSGLCPQDVRTDPLMGRHRAVMSFVPGQGLLPGGAWQLSGSADGHDQPIKVSIFQRYLDPCKKGGGDVQEQGGRWPQMQRQERPRISSGSG
jgi:hypothetical protein